MLVGGDFLNVAGVPRARLAEIATATGAATLFDPGADGSVRSIVPSGDGSTVYLGGDFGTVAVTARGSLATVNSAGALLAWDPGTDGTVHEIVEASDQASVYVAGSFGTAGGSSRANLAQISTAGTATSFDPGANATVFGLALTGGDSEVIAAGAFTTIAGSSRNRLAEIRTSNGTATSWDPDANGEAWTVAVGSGEIFAGGAFGSINGVARANLAALDAASGALDTSWVADTNDEVLALDVSFDDLTVFVGGRFTDVDGFTRNRIAAVKATNGDVLTSFKPQASGNVFAVHATREHVYVGGEFTSIASNRRSRVASLDPILGSLDLNFRVEVDARVRSITSSPDGNLVYIGGDFSSVDGVSKPNLAALEAATGDPVFSFNGVTGRRVYNMRTDDDRLYAAMGGGGGLFAAMDLVTGATDYDIATDGDVQAVTLMGDYAYVGGHYDLADGQSRVRLFAVDRATGTLSNDWTPSADGELSIFGMANYSGAIWLGGDFNLMRSRTSQHVAKIGGIVESDGLYGSTVVLDGADAYWRLGEAVGVDATEEIDNEDGTYAGSPSLGVAGLITGGDTAVDFGGADHVALPDDGAINTGGPYNDRTFELWFEADATAARQVLIETGGTTRGYVVYVEGGSVHGGAWNTTSDGGDTPWGPVWTSWPISANTTYHVALVHDVTGDELRLYVNGVLRDTANGVGMLVAHARDSAIGAMIDQSRFPSGSETGDGFEFSGTIDEVAIYDEQLAAGQIGNHYATGTIAPDALLSELGFEETRLVDEPLSYWRFGDPDIVVDSVGEQHGEPLGDVRRVRGRVGRGGASAFDGIDDVVRLPDDVRANTGGPVIARTIEATFVSRSSEIGVVYEEGGVQRGLVIYTNSGYVHAGAWDTSPSAIAAGDAFVAFASGRIPRGKVTHVALVFDTAASSLRLYVDGALADERIGVASIGKHPNDRAIGGAIQGTRTKRHARYGAGLFFKGVIDEILMYDTALSADTILEHAASTRDAVR